jgi:hypothetical protein
MNDYRIAGAGLPAWLCMAGSKPAPLPPLDPVKLFIIKFFVLKSTTLGLRARPKIYGFGRL